MIKLITKKGDLLAVSDGHIVHGCNAQGVMGSGVALAVKNKYPHVFEEYKLIHKMNGLNLGEVYPVPVSSKLFIWNAITQQGFGAGVRQVSYDAIASCFEEINKSIGTEGGTEIPPKEIHIPMIGAGLGGGNWEIIKTIIEQTVDYPTTVWIL